MLLKKVTDSGRPLGEKQFRLISSCSDKYTLDGCKCHPIIFTDYCSFFSFVQQVALGGTVTQRLCLLNAQLILHYEFTSPSSSSVLLSTLTKMPSDCHLFFLLSFYIFYHLF